MSNAASNWRSFWSAPVFLALLLRVYRQPQSNSIVPTFPYSRTSLAHAQFNRGDPPCRQRAMEKIRRLFEASTAIHCYS